MFMLSPHHQSDSSELRPKAALVVGSWQGDVGVVRAESGAVQWRRQTGRELGTLAQDGTRFYVSLGLPLSLHEDRHRATTPAKQERVDRRAEEAEAQASPLECHRLVDGKLLWVKDDWRLKGRLHVEVDGDTVLVASNRSARPPDVEQILALDRKTGALRWSVLGNETPEGHVRLLAAGGGRTFLLNGTVPVPFQAVESQTGRELWSAVWPPVSLLSQPHSALVATIQHRRDQEAEVILLHAEDGTEANRIPIGGQRLHLFTDTGIVYISSDDDSHPWVAAVEASGTGGERWRTEAIQADTLALDSGRVYYACLHDDPHGPHHRDKVAEVGALESETGRPLWSWRSPGDTAVLLRLWGLRHQLCWWMRPRNPGGPLLLFSRLLALG
jgi:outer membrane protein assembly factor BamB